MRRCPRLSDHRPPSTPLFPYTTLFRSDILFYQNLDRPGILASVAGALASQGINIGALSLGRSGQGAQAITAIDRKSTRLNSSHVAISYAGFCMKKKNP